MRFPEDVNDDVVNRLRRLEGQIRGVQRMIEEGQDCRDVVTVRVRRDDRQQPRRQGARRRRRLHHPVELPAAPDHLPRWRRTRRRLHVVLKPSEVAPLDAYILAEIIDEVGLPAGVFNLVTGTGPSSARPSPAHPDIDMVSFTGSTRAGKQVAAAAASTVKRVALELGGKSANIILDDADLEAVIPKGIFACYLNSGQTCTAHTRMLVPEQPLRRGRRIAAAAAENMPVDDPSKEGMHLGPLISQAQWDRVQGYIQQGIDEGAVVAAGGLGKPEGHETGYFVKPTVLANVTNDMTVAQEEIFGPVLSIIGYEDEDDAVRIANDSLYGLSGGVWSADKERAIAVARRMRTGAVDVNGGSFNIAAPFGGYKQSGYGRENGPYGIDEFLQTKSLQL
jgi:aldehyde dehydrogenase (NAD+)